SYLVDFYHVCDYLAAAAPVCAPTAPEPWLESQKQRLKIMRCRRCSASYSPMLKRRLSTTSTLPSGLVCGICTTGCRSWITKGRWQKTYPLGREKSRAPIAISSKTASNSRAHGGKPTTSNRCSHYGWSELMETGTSIGSNSRWLPNRRLPAPHF